MLKEVWQCRQAVAVENVMMVRAFHVQVQTVTRRMVVLSQMAIAALLVEVKNTAARYNLITNLQIKLWKN
jgi:hypothetical protein